MQDALMPTMTRNNPLSLYFFNLHFFMEQKTKYGTVTKTCYPRYQRYQLYNLGLAMIIKQTAIEDEDIHALANIEQCWCPSFSPDGRELAFLSNRTGLPQVWVVDSNGGCPKQVTVLNDPVTYVFWSPKGHYLAFNTAPDGGMNEQVSVLNLECMSLIRITNGGPDNNRLYGWTPNGESLVISSNTGCPDAMAIYFVTLNGEWDKIAETWGLGHHTDISRNGTQAIVFSMRARGDSF